jgi:hypothetical protein
MKAHLGIDWGTHSSKWACYLHDREKYSKSFPLYSSDITCANNTLTFGEELANDDDGVRGLKGVLITDPLGGSFWESSRLDTGTSLGAAVSFSLCCLLANAFEQLKLSNREVEIAFSFPNWLVDTGKKTAAAARNFREAAAVAVHLVNTLPSSQLPKPGRRYAAQDWVAAVRDSKDRAVKDLSTFDIETVMQTSFESAAENVTWGFITESGAAGLPYLRALDIEDVPGAHGLAKILVIDIGAGSTDIGYMLRTRHRETGKEKLYYFRPASSFPVAGNELTNELLTHQSAKNQPITRAEAEARKLQDTGWHNLAFVKTWRKRISQHVAEYVTGIPDFRWLPLPVTLNVVLTGGSGLVPGIKEAVKLAAVKALESRGVDSRTCNKVITPGEHLPNLSFRTEAEYARRAVCLGASDSDRPGCTYTSSMDPPSRARFAVARKWV